MAVLVSWLDPPHRVASETAYLARSMSLKAGALPRLTSEAGTSSAPPDACPQPCPPLPRLPSLLQTARLQPAHMPAAAFLLIYVSILQFLPSEIFLKVSSVLHHVQAVMILSACARSS